MRPDPISPEMQARGVHSLKAPEQQLERKAGGSTIGKVAHTYLFSLLACIKNKHRALDSAGTKQRRVLAGVYLCTSRVTAALLILIPTPPL